MKGRLLPVKVLDAGCATRWSDLNREYNEYTPRSKTFQRFTFWI